MFDVQPQPRPRDPAMEARIAGDDIRRRFIEDHGDTRHFDSSVVDDLSLLDTVIQTLTMARDTIRRIERASYIAETGETLRERDVIGGVEDALEAVEAHMRALRAA